MRGSYLVIEPQMSAHKSGFKPVPLTASPGLRFMQELVGGPIQAIPRFTIWQGEKCVAICNEEGKMRRLPFNETASSAWTFITKTTDFLVGNVVIFQGDEEFLDSIL